MKRLKKSVIIPLTLLLYLVAMSIVGFPYYQSGQHLYYFGIIGATLCVIIILHFVLKKREKLQEQRKNEMCNSGKDSGNQD